MRLLLAALLPCAAACMTPVGAAELQRPVLSFSAPAQLSGGVWAKVETPDYVLFTDHAAPEAERAAQLLSQSLVGLRSMFGRAPILAPRRLMVVAMRDGMDFERRFGKLTWGFAYTTDDQVTLCLYGPPDRWFVRSEVGYEGKQSVLQHELAHAVLGQYFPSQPKWFAEGLSQFLETFRWLDAETVRLGDPHLVAYRNYRAVRSLTVKDMLAWDSLDEREATVAGYYGLSWAFVHWARNRRPKELGAYMATLAQQGPRWAWAESFGPIDETLDEEIYRYMKVGAYDAVIVKVKPAPLVPAAVAAASPAEAQWVKGRLDAMEQATKRR